jgi:hypothetical protein
MGNNMEMSDKGAKWGLTQSSGLELHMVGHAAAMHTLDQQALLSNSLKLTNCKLGAKQLKGRCCHATRYGVCYCFNKIAKAFAPIVVSCRSVHKPELEGMRCTVRMRMEGQP